MLEIRPISKRQRQSGGYRGRQQSARRMSAAVSEALENRCLLHAVIAPPDSVIFDTRTNGVAPPPLGPKPGHSYYVAGATSQYIPVSQWADNSAITPNTKNDLVLNVAPFSTNYFACCEGTGDSPNLLTNGITQSQVTPGSGATPAVGDGKVDDPSNPQNVIADIGVGPLPYYFKYNLGTAGGATPGTKGYDLSEIDVITGHQDYRVAIDNVDILVEPVGSTQFVSLSNGNGFSLTSIGAVPLAKGSAQMAIVNQGGGPIATNIQAVEFAVLNTATFFRELVVSGTASTNAPTSPTVGVPGNVTAGFSMGSGDTVTWSAPSGGATGYTVLRSTSASGPFAAIGTVADQTSFIDQNIVPNTNYYYEVTAAGPGDSAPSKVAAVTSGSFGAAAVVAPPDPALTGDNLHGAPLAPEPGHSLYVTGGNFQGAALSTWSDASAITPNLTNDLLLNVAPSGGNYSPTNEAANSAPGNTSALNSERLLTNGITQSQVGNFPASGPTAANGDGTINDPSSGSTVLQDNVSGGWNLIYQLGNYGNYNAGTVSVANGATPSSTGYDISEIDVISGHQDNNSRMQVEIMVEPIGSSQFYSLSNGQDFTLTSIPAGGDQGGTGSVGKGSAQMAIISAHPGQPIASNIQAIKFINIIPTTFLRELVVSGVPSTVLPATPPAPQNVSASFGTAATPTITWTPSPGAMGYTVERSTDGVTYQLAGSVLNQTSFQDFGVQPNTAYTYEVIASGNGDSPPSAATPSITTPNFGATAYFFAGQAWQGAPVLTETLPQINYTGSGTTDYPLSSAINPNNFSVLIEGKVTSDAAGTYLFNPRTDDDGYLWINGQLVSTNLGNHGVIDARVQVPISLAAHTAYNFVFLEDNQTGPWGFELYWREPGMFSQPGPSVPVPGTQLSPNVDAPPSLAAVTPTVTALSDSAVQVNWTTPTPDVSSYAYVLMRAPADAFGNPTDSFTQVGQIFSGPASLVPPYTSQFTVPQLAPNSWGVTAGVDSTTAPDMTYVYEVGVIAPGQTSPDEFSPWSAPVTTPDAPTIAPGGILNLALEPYDNATVLVDPLGNLEISENGISLFDGPPSQVSSLNITGPLGSPATVTLSGNLNFSGNVSITNVSSFTINGQLTAAGVQVRSTGNVVVNTGSSITSTGSVDLEANNNLTLDGSVTSHGAMTLLADNDNNYGGQLLIAPGVTINSNNNPISTHFGSLNVQGTVNAGSGNITYAGTANSFSASGYAAHTISSGTVTVTSGSITPNFNDTWNAGTTGTVWYDFPAATNPGVSTSGINTSAGKANIRITSPIQITVTGPLNTGGGTITLEAPNVSISTGPVTSPNVTDTPLNADLVTIPTNATMTLNGPMTLTARVVVSSGATLHVNGGLTLNGSIQLNNGSISFDGAQTLTGTGQILFGTGTDNLYFTGGTLTLDKGITVTGVVGATGTVNIARHDAGSETLINLGTINANHSGQVVNLSALASTPGQGTFEATAGGTLSVAGLTGILGPGFSATGSGSRLFLNGPGYTIDSGLSASSSALVELDGSWSNRSSISLNQAAANLGGNFLTDAIGAISALNGQGTVNITGALDNNPSDNPITNGSLTLSATSGSWVLAGGSIKGGTVSGAALVSNTGGLLNGTTLATGLNINNSSVTVVNGLTLANNSVVTLNSTASAPARLAFLSTQSLSGQGQIVFNGDGAATVGYMPLGQSGSPATLTIGPGISISTGSGSAVLGSGIAGNQIVNNGTITVTAPESLTILDALTTNGTTSASIHTSVTWTGAGNDNLWTDPANWSTGVLPGASDSVVINGVAGPISISAGIQSIYSLFTSVPINLSSGVLQVATSAQLNAALTLAGGTLRGGAYSVSSPGSMGVTADSTLDGVTLNANLTIPTPLTLHVIDGLTLNSKLTVNGGRVSFDGTQTLSGTPGVGGIVLAGPTTDGFNVTGGQLTVASGISIADQAGATAAINFTSSDGQGSVLNAGTFSFTTAGQIINVSLSSLTNQGTFTATGSALNVAMGSQNWTNSGTLSMSGVTLNDPGDTLTNSGTFTASGAITAASLVNNSSLTLTGGNTQIHGPVTNSGHIFITGILATFYGFMNDAGTIKTTNATGQYLGGASVTGTYTSDPSDNYFASLTIGPGGALQGSTGDRFVLTGDLENDSTSPNWNTQGAELELQGTGSKQITGSAPPVNFVWGALTVDPGTTVVVTGSGIQATSITNDGTLDVEAPVTGTNVVNNGNLHVNAPLAATTVTNNGALQATVPVAAPVVGNGQVTLATGLSAVSAGGTFGGLATLTATLSSLGTLVPGEMVSFSLNGAPVGTAMTDTTGTAVLNSVSLAGIGAGTYSSAITASFAGDPSYLASTATGSLSVATAALTISMTNASRVYGQANPTFAVSYSGLVGGDTPQSLAGTLAFTTTATATSDVGTYGVGVSGVSSPNYQITFTPGTLTVNPAPATAVYSGSLLATATSTGQVSFALQAQVHDTSGGVGDIRNSTVSFQIYDSTGTRLLVTVPGSAVSLVNAADKSTGVSTGTWSTNLKGATQQSYRVVVVVGNDYAGTTAQNAAMLIASMPSRIDTATGAGQLIASRSAGTYAAKTGSSIVFAFGLTDPTGTTAGLATVGFQHVAADGKLHSYLITSTSIISYGTQHSTGQLNLVARATLLDITNPLAPVTIASNLTLEMSATDPDALAAGDSIAISLWGGGSLYFASNWDGLQSVQQQLKLGGIEVL